MMALMMASLIVPMASSLIKPVTFSLINAISRKGVMRAGKVEQGGILLLFVLPLMGKVLEKGVRREGKGYMDKTFLVPLHPLSNIKITKYFNSEPKFNVFFFLSKNYLPRIKNGAYVINLDYKKEKKHTRFHNLLI